MSKKSVSSHQVRSFRKRTSLRSILKSKEEKKKKALSLRMLFWKALKDSNNKP